ncbi:MAG: TIM-barrel domain-containing protein, partial [bacterium]
MGVRERESRDVCGKGFARVRRGSTACLFFVLFAAVLSAAGVSAADGGGGSTAPGPAAVGGVLEARVADSHVLFVCGVGEGVGKVFIRISFPFPSAVRVEGRLNGEPAGAVESVKFEVKRDEGVYEVSNGVVSVRVEERRWKMSITRNGGGVVFAEFDGGGDFSGMGVGAGMVRVTAAMHPGERFYGFGEKFDGVDQRGKEVTMELSDAYQSTTGATYKSIPFFISSGRYGILLNSPMRCVFRMGSVSDGFYSFEVPDGEIDYYVFADEGPLGVIRDYTEVTGRIKLVPRWALEPWLSRREMVGWTNTATAEADVDMMIADGYRLGVVLWEGFRRRFYRTYEKQVPDITDLVNRWHRMGLKLVFWSMTGQLDDTPEEREKYGFSEERNGEFFVRNPDGSFLLGGIHGGKVYIDPTNPEAMEWWLKTVYEHRLLGEGGASTREKWNLDGVKIDFCEFFPGDETPVLMKDRRKGMANIHPVLFSERVYDWRQEMKPDGGITWVRGG